MFSVSAVLREYSPSNLSAYDLTVAFLLNIRDQQRYASRIKPIRKNGHLLLVTLLLANMIVNETLPIIADPVLGGGAQSVVVSTVLIVMYVCFDLSPSPHPNPAPFTLECFWRLEAVGRAAKIPRAWYLFSLAVFLEEACRHR